MNLCLDCEHLFEDDEKKIWYEHHPCGMATEAEKFSGCPLCKGSYIEVNPCTLCGSYPAEEYDDEETLPHGGICQECFNSGIQKHFMEYLETLEWYEQREFYFGNCDGGYVYDSSEMLDMARTNYNEHIKLIEKTFGLEKEAKRWTSFVNDSDPYHFGEWLIGIKRK